MHQHIIQVHPKCFTVPFGTWIIYFLCTTKMVTLWGAVTTLWLTYDTGSCSFSCGCSCERHVIPDRQADRPMGGVTSSWPDRLLYHWLRTTLFECYFWSKCSYLSVDAAGVRRSLEDRRRASTTGGSVHRRFIELCPGLSVPLPAVWKCSSCGWEAVTVSTISKC